MLDKAVIYLSDRRLCEQSPVFRTYQTQVDKTPILNFLDNTLAPATNSQEMLRSKILNVAPEIVHYRVFVLPLVGVLLIGEEYIEAGKMYSCRVENSQEVIVQNPYESALVNYLEIWIEDEALDNKSTINTFDLSNKNQLVPAYESLQTNVWIGNFDGRKEGVLTLNNSVKTFVFVVNGAFEVQNRLLETRDGLLLTDTKEITFEALSEEAILLIITFC
jgi:Quercetinase C-terminal cupin domain